MFKRPHYLALAVVLVIVLVVLSLPARTAERLKLALGSVFIPLFGLAGTGQTLADKAEKSLIPRRALIDQIDELKRENEQLRLKELQWDQISRENDQLRQAIGWVKNSPGNFKLGRVILRDPTDWWRTLQIDLGQRDGITTNMPVLTSEGLIGRVHQVAYSRSQIVLIGNPNCRVASLVENGSPKGVDGIITSASATAFDGSVVNLSYVDGQAALQPGQRVVTSGLSGIYPKGIPIGHIIDWSSVGFGMYTEARVKLAADLRHLDHVFIMCQ